MAIVISVLSLEEIEIGPDMAVLHAWIDITNDGAEWVLGVGGIPVNLDNAGVQAYLDERKDYLWQVALVSGKPIGSVFRILPAPLIQRALIELIFTEIEVLRRRAGLTPQRNKADWIARFIEELKAMPRKSA